MSINIITSTVPLLIELISSTGKTIFQHHIKLYNLAHLGPQKVAEIALISVYIIYLQLVILL